MKGRSRAARREMGGREHTQAPPTHRPAPPLLQLVGGRATISKLPPSAAVPVQPQAPPGQGDSVAAGVGRGQQDASTSMAVADGHADRGGDAERGEDRESLAAEDEERDGKGGAREQQRGTAASEMEADGRHEDATVQGDRDLARETRSGEGDLASNAQRQVHSADESAAMAAATAVGVAAKTITGSTVEGGAELVASEKKKGRLVCVYSDRAKYEGIVSVFKSGFLVRRRQPTRSECSHQRAPTHPPRQCACGLGLALPRPHAATATSSRNSHGSLITTNTHMLAQWPWLL